MPPSFIVAALTSARIFLCSRLGMIQHPEYQHVQKCLDVADKEVERLTRSLEQANDIIDLKESTITQLNLWIDQLLTGQQRYLSKIVALETPRANSTVRRMAAIARGGLEA